MFEICHARASLSACICEVSVHQRVWRGGGSLGVSDGIWLPLRGQGVERVSFASFLCGGILPLSEIDKSIKECKGVAAVPPGQISVGRLPPPRPPSIKVSERGL